MSVLEVRDLSKQFGGIHAVEGVSFDVNEGEILGIIGPNGSGKSTLFNCILGQLPPSSGEVRLAGPAVTRLPSGAVNPPRGRPAVLLVQVFPALNLPGKLLPAPLAPQGFVVPSL